MSSVSLPNGVSFSHRLTVERIPEWQAVNIHEQHHSYQPYFDRVAIVHHGAVFDKELIGAVSYAMPRRSVDLDGVDCTDMAEVARVSVAVDMPNAASCLMAASQDKFESEHAVRNGFGLLMTQVREDYDGTMFAALAEKGWRYLREARSGESGNREKKPIQTADKAIWVCPLDVDRPPQAELDGFALDAEGGSR